ncbi:MAG: alpha/beta hydrolase [Chitinophagaceae bacterium]
MKNLLVSIGLMSCVVGTAQNIEGNWKGDIHPPGQSLTIVFHYVKQVDGTYKTSFDSPAQNVFNLQGGVALVKADSLINDIPLIKGGYRGKITGDSITGIWQQGPGTLPLVLHRNNEMAPAPILKPQTPVPPFPYTSQDLIYYNQDKSITYGATITYPKNGKNLPAVLLITGSGQQNRDCDIMGHKWFLVLADYLTRKGFAVLRVDDRGIGQTTGDVMGATSADFAKDVEQGIAYLKTRKEINPKKIGLIGHSEGGMIAPMVAARNKDVAYIVMLAGPGIGGAIINEEQNVANVRKAGVSDSGIQQFRLLHRELQQAAINATNDSAFERMVRTALAHAKSKTTEAAKVNKNADEVEVQNIVRQYGALRMPWLRFFMSYKPTADIAELQIPVLALNGSKDSQVDAGMNLPAIKKALLKNKSPFTKTVRLEGLNHLFQKCTTGEVSEYGTIEETFNPVALKTISDWLVQVTK